ncbi:MAG: restriction endonuclease [Chloroflexota bacterium]
MAAEFPDFDLYAELEVSERASVETIQAAYRSLQLRHHPDRVGDAGGDRAVRLNIARDWLTDPRRRASYDAHLAEARAAGLDDVPEADEIDNGGVAEDVADDEANGVEGAPGDVDDEARDADDPGVSLIHILRHHLRLDVKRFGRIWLIGLAILGALALVPAFVTPATTRAIVAAVVTLVLAGIALGWRRAGDGMGSMMARWMTMLIGWVLIGVLAVEGVQALLQLVRREATPSGIVELAIPALAITALLSLFAVRRRHGPVETSVDEFLAMTPREFETAVGQVLGRHGYKLTVTGGPGDLAADLVGTDPDGRSTVVQCKRYAPGHPVGSRDVQMLIAMGLRHHDAEHLILVTTSEFTDPARDLGDEHEVELISGEDLEDLTR